MLIKTLENLNKYINDLCGRVALTETRLTKVITHFEGLDEVVGRHVDDIEKLKTQKDNHSKHIAELDNDMQCRKFSSVTQEAQIKKIQGNAGGLKSVVQEESIKLSNLEAILGRHINKIEEAQEERKALRERITKLEQTASAPQNPEPDGVIEHRLQAEVFQTPTEHDKYLPLVKFARWIANNEDYDNHTRAVARDSLKRSGVDLEDN